MTKDGGRIDDSCAGFVDLEVIESNRRVGESGGESLGLRRREVGLLKTKDVSRGKEIAETRGDEVPPVDEVRGDAVVGQTINVVRNNAGHRQRKIGKQQLRGGRPRGLKGTSKHES